MPRCYQFDNMPVKSFVVGSVHDAQHWRGYSTAMVTRIGPRRAKRLFIKEWMDAKEVSDERAANRIGVARETVYRWRKEQHRLNPEKIALLASALDMEPEEFHRPPGRRSLDALVKNAPDDLHKMAVDIVERLLGKAS